MTPKTSLRTEMQLQGRLKLARLLSMREEDFAALTRKLEADPLFSELAAQGVLIRTPFTGAYFAARRLAGMDLAPADTGLGELLDGRSDIVKLMKKIGRECFEQCFLRDASFSGAEIARRCGITPGQARDLRELLDRLYIRAQSEPARPAPAKVFSAVAAIAVHNGRPCLRFFNREIWRSNYRLDSVRLKTLLSGSGPDKKEEIHRYLRRVELANHRKTSLYRALEALLPAQAEYLKTGNPSKRQPLTQRSMATALGMEPSAFHRLIANKSVELPWGTEAPLKALMPSAKTLAKDKLENLATEEPNLSDEGLRRELARRHQIHLSRRSVAQYRLELRIKNKKGRKGPPLLLSSPVGGGKSPPRVSGAPSK